MGTAPRIQGYDLLSDKYAGSRFPSGYSNGGAWAPPPVIDFQDEKLPLKLVGSRFLGGYKNGMGSSYLLTDDASYLCPWGRRIMRRPQCPNCDSRRPGHSDYPDAKTDRRWHLGNTFLYLK
ncbi:hypothetical protein AVEN_256897-1 [Araneus ventricosus]|uniref:Uncharacterized protein n=1 Tax=Araneus ventricosus TaxID=182803 RepID=A0A4Y2CG70_ARAVE|nr:hypothetical protein AVEN_256897-1 [Araneus ventricosus]